ncbi:DUF7793 family protein [Bizionia arctica]|uniref:DUF7793 domain-containing protein n=1 Tax=Bizionia arctica TaxID=1495645 RepID=A0A917LMS4_9FLAO|nr:hypothetical protein [Bizionia arctica]GGG43927.1 hypothetical protein GCM10010976_14400 [Bizionia arctica]
MNNEDNIITIGSTKLWTDAKDILYCKFSSNDPNSQLDSIRANKYINAIALLCNGKAMPFSIDLRGSRGTFLPNAAILIANSPTLKKLRISEAFITDSIGIKLLIASYKRIYDPTTPYRILNNTELAQHYCKETKNKFYGSN